MAYRVSQSSLELAVRHLARYGDTDIFPHLPELAFLTDEEKAVVQELAKLDLDSYMPAGAIEALAPKARYSFRIAHQLSALDTLLLLACVIEIGDKIEGKRQPVPQIRSFSYRFSPDSSVGQLFRKDRTYKDWLHGQLNLLSGNPKITHVLSTDISDYYSRINFHRLDNLLDEVASKHGASRFIKKHISVIRAKQSFGLPVGGSAARLLAELALADTDQALRDQGLRTTRFVDDFRIFLTANYHPYDALGFLAEQLGINEGLSLNSAKTEVIERDAYIVYLETATSDLEEEAEGVALDALTTGLYFDDEPDPDDLEKLKGLNLVEMLRNEIEGDHWDVGRIKVLFRALKIAKPKEAIEFISEKFSELVVFGKELVLLMEALEDGSTSCFDDLCNEVVQAILSPPASSVQVIRTWLLEIFVRDIIAPLAGVQQKLEGLSAVIDKRQLLLIRGGRKDVNYFRKQKTAVQSFSDVERPCLVWGASCLPQDEYNVWLKTAGIHLNKPLDGLYLKWVSTNKGKLIAKLKSPVADELE
jgi:reverse transcriptase-like protein